MKLSEWKLYSIYALGHILQGSPEADKKYLKILYKYLMGKECNFDNPQTYSEKLQWLKIYDRNPLYTQLVDKYEVRKYVEERIGKEHLIPCLGVWNHFDEIDFDKLPNQFVLKCTHDSGGLIICKDNSKLDLKKARKKIEHCLKRNYFLNHREWPYKDVPPRIIAEEYLENNEEGLHDYKIWCFNGEPVYIQYITGRIGDQTYERFYNLNWELQNFSYHNPLMKEPVKRPDCLEELLWAASELAKNQPFVRTDFYVLEDGSIRFGEITFYPMSGMEQWHPAEMDRMLGDRIDLNFGR